MNLFGGGDFFEYLCLPIIYAMFEMMSDNSYTNLREMLRGSLSDLQVRSENSGVIGVSSGFQVLENNCVA